MNWTYTAEVEDNSTNPEDLYERAVSFRIRIDSDHPAPHCFVMNLYVSRDEEVRLWSANLHWFGDRQDGYTDECCYSPTRWCSCNICDGPSARGEFDSKFRYRGLEPAIKYFIWNHYDVSFPIASIQDIAAAADVWVKNEIADQVRLVAEGKDSNPRRKS